MKSITLIRHSDAEFEKDSGDFNRPLTSKGVLNTRNSASWLREKNIPADLILVSSSLRATATMEAILQEGAFNAARTDHLSELYLASARTLKMIISRVEDKINNLVICAHNPGISELCSYLDGNRFYSMGTASVFHAKLSIENWSEMHSGCMQECLINF